MSQVHARFRLDQVNRSRGYYCKPGERETKTVEAAHIILNAVQGEPFGAASPMGKFEMLIVNPPAAQVFFEAKIGQEFDILMTPVESK